ncbi:hypothetical protein GCM10009627_27670 [Curtobacterium herbarum]|uniref:Uncharacterized protein n=1 Tax=Curtobacterium herbarum TaxID=150122 RepID=A0ABP4K5Z5_9MICO
MPWDAEEPTRGIAVVVVGAEAAWLLVIFGPASLTGPDDTRPAVR